MADQPNVQATYEEAMNTGHAAAWDQNWEKAIGAYMMAVRARPDDPAAHNSLGLALLQARRLPDALKIYERARTLDPDDPVPLEKSADVLERLGRLQDAAQQYMSVAEIYLAQHDLEKAISNWERATRVTPGLIKVHQKLALAYERTGDRKQAVREYLTLAGNFQRIGKGDTAIQAVERALRLEPKNPQALNALQALRSGAELTREATDERLKAKNVDAGDAFEADPFDISLEATQSDPRGPIGEAIESALEQLATDIFSNEMLMMQPSGMNVIQAIEFHRQGAVDEAIGAYQRAESAGVNFPALFMNIGALMVERQRWKEAISYLERVQDAPQLMAGANHGLGIAYMEQQKTRQATTFLIKTMQLVDMKLAISPDEAGQLGAVYDQLLARIRAADEKTLSAMNQRFFNLLTGRDWKQRVELTRHQLEDAITDDPERLLDVASVSPEIIQAMNRIDSYMNTRRYILALDEAFNVVSKEPDYLAAHLKIGQILVQMNRVHQAIEKYNLIAETYIARGNKARAGEILNEVIKIAPMDIRLRQTFIEFLETDEKWPEILEQYISLADAYFELGDYNNARTTYNQAIQMAQRIGADKSKVIKILHRLADLDMTRLEVRGAFRNYENIKNLDPADEKARKMLVELNFRLSDPAAAIRELDALLQHYAKERNGRAMLELLEGWVVKRPNEEGIRSRLAAVYQQIKRNKEALEQLNALLELQLNNGRHTDACQTLKRILPLQPPQQQHYLNLMQQLGCG
ncbi:MAG: tetratricopeptide repeat protein [Chloroflexi bacterium]|nr:tetratricopeptide repeat protein [Chloroflexota bacterium]